MKTLLLLAIWLVCALCALVALPWMLVCLLIGSPRAWTIALSFDRVGNALTGGIDGEYLSANGLYGTGYGQARDILQGHAVTGPFFGVLKFLGNIASSWAGIPGGIFSPALAVGAGLGGNIASLLPSADSSAVVLLGMAAYLSGVTQSPLTAAVISLELTANRQMALPIMAACLLARAVSALVCRVPVYKALAGQLVMQYEEECARRHPPATEGNA
jgi:H+/Cl- antiporter ClcA